ncbi:MAG: hypothetical protein LC126_29605 [Bryobacterales bacterium]|nr:hypothetical protein [Bryobacterales bacterium]
MPRNARIYIACVAVLGLGLLVLSLATGWESQDAVRYTVYVGLALIASTWKVRLPGMQGTMSANFLLILIGVAELSMDETLAMASLAAVVQCLWRAAKRPAPVQILFNAGAICLSVYASYQIAHLFSAAPRAPVYLALAAAVFFIINTGLVSQVLALLNGKRLLDVWRNCHLWTFPYYLAGAGITAVICAADRTMGWKQSLLPLGLMYLLYTYYRTYMSEHLAVLTNSSAVAGLGNAIGALAARVAEAGPESSAPKPASS